MADLEIQVAGERLTLLPERALFWPRANTLLIADPHWGKAASFRAAALPVPEAGTANDLARLERALERTGAHQLVILGDLLHAKAGRAPALFAAVGAWRARHPKLAITLVRGNHDRSAGDPPPEWAMACVDEPHLVQPFALCHHPDLVGSGYWLAGHLHPAVLLVGAGRQRERLACFLFGAQGALLPAFGGFTGAATVQPRSGERVFVLAGDEVIEIGH